ncbi:MAG: hypothetical protein KatS3mg114_0207 [Planctomycetaceae bacterium]|nr:MAG: hypothetical protein KatS3mg114_0207 [Planctomycetaceae bacterium]
MNRCQTWLLWGVVLWCHPIVESAAADPYAQPLTSTAPLARWLAEHCLSCHAGEEPAGGLRLSSREGFWRGGDSGAVYHPGQWEQSLIWQRVQAGDMPPQRPLSAAERLPLQRWLQAGAPWGEEAFDPWQFTTTSRAGYDWWAWQPLKRPQPPEDPWRTSAHPIDGFIRQALRARGLQPNPPAERTILLRRLSFDLLGLPPTPQDVAEFLADDHPLAYERLVDRLLASPHYGERWARHWMDIIRFGESNGFERDLPREHAWHYRNWLITAFNRDVPYDEFVRWQLAADTLSDDPLEAAAALGFLVAGPHDTVIPVVERMRRQMQQDELEDLISVVAQTFLGLTLHCARCHDHKFDPLSMQDYYQMAACLSGVNHGERELIPPQAQQQLQQLEHELQHLQQRLQQQWEAWWHQNSPTEQAAVPILLPTPVLHWDLTDSLTDRTQQIALSLQGAAQQTPDGLWLSGGYACSAPLPFSLRGKTLAVEVQLADLDQRGGAVVSLQSLDGQTFEAIVYGEQEPRQWMAGSEFFRRTQPLRGPAEEEAHSQYIRLVWVYDEQGRLTAYRQGQVYGRSYTVPEAWPLWEAGSYQVLVGLRHTPARPDRLLHGVVRTVCLFDRPLTRDQAAAWSQPERWYEDAFQQQLDEHNRSLRQQQLARQQQLLSERERIQRDAPVKMYTPIFTQPPVQHILKRGNVDALGPRVEPAGLPLLTRLTGDWRLPADAPEHVRRAKLADWITHRENPLLTRVIVNRIWQYHFGRGLVETPSDFGFHAGTPSHPELLDWLATEFRDQGYSLKALHRWIVTSETYRQSSQMQAEALTIDADNRWLWRMSPRRLEAECLRDAMLVAADVLDHQVGGRGYTDFHSYFFKGTQFYDPLPPADSGSFRRTVYRMWARGGRQHLLDAFDCPDPSTATPRRAATTTPLQALALLNNPFTAVMAERVTARLKHKPGLTLEQQIVLVYLWLYQRQPLPDEVRLTAEFVKQWGWPAAVRGMFNSSEFLYVE